MCCFYNCFGAVQFLTDCPSPAERVWRFNDMKNFIVGDRLTTWVVREDGKYPGKILGAPSRNIARAMNTILDKAAARTSSNSISLATLNLSQILVVGFTPGVPKALLRAQKRIGTAEVDYVPVFEPGARGVNRSLR
jgi:hypothetical protein